MTTLEFSLLVVFGCLIAAVVGLLIAATSHKDIDHDG